MADIERGPTMLGIAIRGSLFVYFAGTVLAFASQILLARLMGAAEYGIYYYALSWLLVFALFSQFGADQTLLRFMPIYAQDRDWAKAHGIAKAGVRLVTTNGLILCISLILIILSLGDTLSSTQRHTFILAALCLPLRGLIYMRQATLRSFMYTARSLIPDAVIAPAVLMMSAVALYALLDSSSAHIFMAATVFALFVSFLIGAYWQLRLIPAEMHDASPSYDFRSWLPVALSLLIINGAHVLLNNVDLLILGLFHTPSDIGIYGASSRLASSVTFMLLATYPVFAPIISKYHAAGRKSELQHAFRQVMRPISALAVLASIVFIFWGSEILSVFGAEFGRGHTVLIILVAGQLVNALCGPVALLLAYAGHEPVTAKVLLAVAIVSACVQFFVIPIFGMNGAAAVSALSVAFWNVTLYVLARRRVGVDPSGWLAIRT